MTGIVDITDISAVVVTAGVVTGIIYYILEIRHQTKIRETDLQIRMNPIFNLTGIDWQKASGKVLSLEYKDYDDFVKKYGLVWTETPTTMAIRTMGNYFEAIGYLLKRKLIDMDYVWDFFGETGIQVWEKINPVLEGHRKQFNMPKAWEPFEYLYNELKKRQQQLTSKTAWTHNNLIMIC